jgi:hypothetical protein
LLATVVPLFVLVEFIIYHLVFSTRRMALAGGWP